MCICICIYLRLNLLLAKMINNYLKRKFFTYSDLPKIKIILLTFMLKLLGKIRGKFGGLELTKKGFLQPSKLVNLLF